jgi:hypothetical protein
MTKRKDQEALVGNAADEEQLDNATRVKATEGQIEHLDVQKVMSTPEGRREYWRILKQCGVSMTSFSGEAPLTMAFNEGQRNVGLFLEARLVKHAMPLYIQMRDEAARENQ